MLRSAGRQHRPCSSSNKIKRAEESRDRELGVPVVHVHPALLDTDEGLGEILDRVWEQLGMKRGSFDERCGLSP